MSETVPEVGSGSRSRGFGLRGLEWLPALLIAASVLPRVLLWFRRDYNHDDFAFAWGTWMRANGARSGVDLYGYGFVFLLVEIVKPLFRITESFFPLDVMRFLVLVVQLANLAFVYAIVRRLGASRAWALAAVALTSWQPDLILRAEDVRTDPFGACCLLASTFLFLDGKTWRRAERIGALLGLAIILDYKFGVAAPFAALALAVITWPRFIVPLFRLTAGAVAVVGAYLGWLIHEDTWSGFLSGLRQTTDSLKIGAAGQAGVALPQIFARSPVIFSVVAVGAIGLLLGLRSRETTARRAGIHAAIVIAFFLVFVKLNPYFFPYNFNLFAPLLATLMPGIPVLLERFSAGRRAAAFALCLVGIAAVGEGLPAMSKVLTRTNEAQKRVVRWIWRSTAPTEHVFDWQGLHLNRPGIFHWWLFSGLLPRYRSGNWYSIADELQRYRVTLLISTYRLRWLNARDMSYVQSHYVWIDTCLLAPGHVFHRGDFDAGEVRFQPPVDGDYRTEPPEIPGLHIDGGRPPKIFRLSRDVHSISVDPTTAPSVFAFIYSTPRRDRESERPCPAHEPLLYGFD